MHSPVIFHPDFQISNRPYTVYGVIRGDSGVLTVIPPNGSEKAILARKRLDLIRSYNRGKERRIRVVELPPLINHSCPSDQSAEVKIDCPEAEASKPGYVDRTWVANEDRADMEIEDTIAKQNDMRLLLLLKNERGHLIILCQESLFSTKAITGPQEFYTNLQLLLTSQTVNEAS
ncbi:hypothetical protein BC833DRAFT_625686 [Globomyces pollinis-pini]|nr:hypothetical protein BC833DRAFT_625686 [Globomyces pollinis-pini]